MTATSLISSLQERRALIEDQIATAAHKSGRSRQDITLVAVSKTVNRSVVDVAYDAGFRLFGENRVQDAQRKFEDPLPSDAKLVMIGQLQSNKAGSAVRLFDRIESVDRASLIDALDKHASGLKPPLPVFIQVNIAEEAQKAGCLQKDVSVLIQRIAKSTNIALQGLMTIAPLVDDPEDVRHVFRDLRELRDRMVSCFPEVDLSTLSMGMTNDFQVAIEEGSTEIRVGRAIFG
jgi:pyridoxal phosphate enzyme (YggS family)